MAWRWWKTRKEVRWEDGWKLACGSTQNLSSATDKQTWKPSGTRKRIKLWNPSIGFAQECRKTIAAFLHSPWYSMRKKFGALYCNWWRHFFFCKTDSFVPLVVPGLSASSGINSSSTSTVQDLSSTSPAQARCEGPAPGDWWRITLNNPKQKSKEGWQSRFIRPFARFSWMVGGVHI